MSAVINKAKRTYQLALSIELIFFLLIFLFLLLWQWHMALSFLLGAFAVFLPHSGFVFMMFFRQQTPPARLKSFYYGELLKFLFTIIFIILAFVGFAALQPIIFFIGYLLGISLNNVIPFLLNKYLNY